MNETGSTADASTRWDFEHQPRRLRTVVLVLAVVIVLVHIAWAFLLVRGDSGVTLGVGDQIAFVAVGVILAGVLLTLRRIRVRAGAPGIELRGPFRSRLWRWDDIVGITFPRSSRWPRLELPGYEHTGILAIQTSDGQEAVDAMGGLRAVIQGYKPSAADPESVSDR